MDSVSWAWLHILGGGGGQGDSNFESIYESFEIVYTEVNYLTLLFTQTIQV